MTELYKDCKHTKTTVIKYSYPAANGWTNVYFKQCLICGEEVEGSRKEKFSKKKPDNKKKR